MADWRQQWQQWSERVEAYSMRERVLILLCLLAVIVGLWQWLFEMPQEQARAQLMQQRQALVNDMKAQQAQLDALLSSEQETGATRELTRLQTERDSLDASLASLSQGLVSADQLPEILQEVLISTTELQLRRVRTLPVEELPLTSSDAKADATPRETGVYRHSVEIEVTGDYFETLAFLRRLEDLPWRFYWDRLDYDVAEYPEGDVLLRVYTLSAEEGLLGV